MQPSASSSVVQRQTGVPGVGLAPWGTHFCQFYATKQDLIDVLVPYFKAGLESNEACMWVTSPPLDVREAWAALEAAIPEIELYRRAGRVGIVSHADWYFGDGEFDPQRVLQKWVGQLERVLGLGCAGLRLSGNSFWFEGAGWKEFAEYEAQVDSVIGQYRMLALCTYPVERCGLAEVADVLKNHQFALLKRHGAWETIESFDRRRMQQRFADALAMERERVDARLQRIEDGLESTDVQGHVVTVGRLRESEARLGLLSRTASRLLATDEPQAVVEELCSEVMEHLGCDVFFNFLVDPVVGDLQLNACAGIPQEEARRINRLAFGVAVCGCVAQQGRRIIAEDLRHNLDPRADLVRSYGVQAYCCHPLVAEGKTLGTLSFGTRTRPRFSLEDVELMRTVADQVAMAMHRVRTKQELRFANERLSEANEQLRLESSRKSEFLAVLSHELRNPLAPIRNSLYILERTEPGGEQARRALRVVDRQVTQLTNLVNDLLDVTRISRNKIQLQRERLELNEAVRRVIDDNRSLFERAGVQVDLDCAGAPLHVHADSTRLAQIVGNVVQNAAKFTRRGGRTLVTVEAAGAMASVRVRDDGVGMAPETVARLFEPFAQADQTLDRSKGGLGLGLALVKGLVELHGGRIRASSEGLGRGSEFVIEFPLEDAPRATAPALHEPQVELVRRRRVLVIEDNVDAADSLREVLEIGEHDVRVAYDGPSGIELARSFLPDLVLCDIGLPGMDGYDVARTLRADLRIGNACLVALSGYALPEDVRRAADSGFAQHLAKPPSLEKLEALLAGIVPGPSSEGTDETPAPDERLSGA